MQRYKKRIKWYTKDVKLQQAISSGVQLAFVNGKGEQCCPFVLCKDYLHDAIYNLLYGTKKSVWGFCYNPNSDSPIDLSAARLLVTNSGDSQMRKKIPALLDFLNQVEQELKIKQTTARECADPPRKYKKCGVYYLVGSKRWLHSPPMVSLYTLLIRSGFVHTVGQPFRETIKKITSHEINAYQYEDRGRLVGAKKGMDRILKEGDRKIFCRKIKDNYPPGMNMKDMHDYMGICAFSDSYTEKYAPKWHKDKK